METLLGNPLEPPASTVTECLTGCPKCCNEIETFIMPVKRSGLSIFLSDTFINNLSGKITPDLLVQKLSSYPDVGKIIYNRPRSNKAPSLKFIIVTVLQLIASGLIKLDFDDDNKCYCTLSVTDLIPACLDDSIWDLIIMVNENETE